MITIKDQNFLRQALEEAKKCAPTETAFSVGCLIVNPQTNQILSRGYSRELPGNTHAEENALSKLQTDSVDVGLDMYVTMEPCSERLSGKKCCVDRILEGGGLIRRVILGVLEPDIFVKCVGVERLRERGVIVERNEDKEFEMECLEVAKRGHEDSVEK
jgi:pyrimidine deaminase RibD-like protein